MPAIDQTFYFILVRWRDDTRYSVENDDPTNKAHAMALVREHDGDVICVSSFNPAEGWCQDATEDFAREWLDELIREGHDFSEEIPPFVETNITLTEADELRRGRAAA